ncbi:MULTISPECIES: hypothetical protein [Nocardia]|uniref:hypothetical protein n=1 Tax=Nocardia TaxID=1817 RepID=UPI0024938F85|nr:hypothetical protein [Nocardia sputorum]
MRWKGLGSSGDGGGAAEGAHRFAGVGAQQRQAHRVGEQRLVFRVGCGLTRA